MELLSRAPQQYVVAASCPWMGAWLCLMMQASQIPIDVNMLLEVKARCCKVRHVLPSYLHETEELDLPCDPPLCSRLVIGCKLMRANSANLEQSHYS